MGSDVSLENEGPPSPSSGVCKCGHPHGDHVTGCETCHANGVTLLAHHPFIPEEPASRPGDAAQVLHKWKGCEQCRHREHASFCPTCRCLAVTSMEEITRTCQQAGGCPEHPVQEAEEPPLTPEEEEEAPSDKDCLWPSCLSEERQQELADDVLSEMRGEELPPQPERRPPYAVTYSVSGHLFEVALSGDATVRAVDGALVIQHHLGPVAGIVSVLPVINKED